jgi:arabinan endo-1,5-alpha-L-arabinosidase
MITLDRGGWIRLLRAAPLIIALVAATTPVSVRPVIGRDFPDPNVLAVGGSYYAYSTASHYGTHVRHVPVVHASALQGTWTDVGDAMPELPSWVRKDATGEGSVWAPDVSARDEGGYLLYFTARAAEPINVQCIGAALSRSPKGPFHPVGNAPLICHPEERDSIDPKAFTDVDGKRYVLYTSGAKSETIWAQPVSHDGLTAIGNRRALIKADRPEEANIVESPALVRKGNEYVLFYSANAYNSGKYFVNYATANSLNGPFEKSPGAMLDKNTFGGALANPGGEDVIYVGGRHYLIFHAYIKPLRRSMFVAGLRWSNGKPSVEMNVQARETDEPTDQLPFGTEVPPERRGVQPPDSD